MGMFDELRCSYPLPAEGANELTYQTKDTPSQFLDLYEIREDGTLWHEAYDIEWVDTPDDRTNYPFSKVISRQNVRWEFQEDFIGEIRFYHWQSGMLEFSAYFIKGKLQLVELIQDRRLKENVDGSVQPGTADAAGERGYGCATGREVRALGDGGDCGRAGPVLVEAPGRSPAEDPGAGDAVPERPGAAGDQAGESAAALDPVAEGAREPQPGGS